tara:strand:+ start:457 stop:597 length:141 start_codon:yes stop_codon:yes gene_type:complete
MIDHYEKDPGEMAFADVASPLYCLMFSPFWLSIRVFPRESAAKKPF